MATVVSICNLALSRLGDEANISSLDGIDMSPMARACTTLYPIALGTMLDMHPWSFATRRATVARVAGMDTAPWRYAYALPADCRRPVNLELEGDARGTKLFDDEFEVVAGDGGSRVLLTNAENPRLRYVINDPPVGAFSATFVDALSWLLAGYLAGQKIRGETAFNYAGMCNKYFQVSVGMALKQDAKLTRVRPRHVAPWIEGR